ncbi:hypothetical protein [Pyrococcus abyssi]|uniref:Uncharacterized protein n=1 Tax=Pyrococcus abyssi (strain GE5 / Orsay) TaxID=272844 RepID=Q9V269_PYRAB|nr:hypothetical protein [Pyrococcus abyssi]CAB49129.1 Hypothetical protein PAB0140 [Pyrococcus abyssi GE5]CCE69581.1 TPA: hypothetical protein PAB0140 [Pyrococcus abyssi GE5]
MISISGVNIDFRGELDDGFEEAFLGTFPRRYLPDVSQSKGGAHVVIDRFKGNKFRVFSVSYGKVDEYKIESPVPSAYLNESPVFFLLQVAARAGAKINRTFITDSVALEVDGRGILFLGYPHSGKSTISALALANNLNLLSTENTVVEAREDGIYVVGGTSVLVYDPRVEEIYNVSVPYTDFTRSGYRIVEVNSERRSKSLEKGVKVELIVVLHTAFNFPGASFSPVTGRKIKKTLWYFATSLLKGMDYYEPGPLDLPITEEIMANLNNLLSKASSVRIVEAFGNHKDVLLRSINDEI